MRWRTPAARRVWWGARLMLLCATLWVAGCAAALAEELDPAGARAAWPPSVDYVADLVADGDIAGSYAELPTRVFRHGSRLREEHVSSNNFRWTLYVNLASQVTTRVVRDFDDVVEAQVIAPRGSGIIELNERDPDLGCMVWLWSGSGLGNDYSSCISADGVELWRGLPIRNSLRQRRAVGIQRRPINDEEVTPPDIRALWRAWGAGARPSGSTNMEVVLEGQSQQGQQERLVVRRFGDWGSRETRWDTGFQRLGYTVGGNSLNFETSLDGHPLALQMQRPLESSLSGRRRGNNQTQSRGQETVLGERCRWVDLFPAPPDQNPLPVHLSECRTREGLPLIVEHQVRNQVARLWAVEVRRGQVSAAMLTPPPLVFEWDN